MNAEPDLIYLAQYCKATADQQRLLILRVLARESFGVMELCHIFATTQPAMSHHLKVLAKAHLVDTRRQGTSIFYRRALIASDDTIRDLRRTLFDAVDELTLDSQKLQQITEVHEARHHQAKTFFEKNAELFQSNQDLIVAYPHYAGCINDLIENLALERAANVVEIGPGDSDLIIDLAQRFDGVVAIDNTQEMLNKTRQRVAAHNKQNVTFIEGELNQYAGPCHLFVLNMVLHHFAAPVRLFAEASERLAPGGHLLIADLCAHDEDWTRQACGDLWQGFDPQELDHWANSAGLKLGQSAYLGLNNGFQIQIRTYQAGDSP